MNEPLHVPMTMDGLLEAATRVPAQPLAPRPRAAPDAWAVSIEKVFESTGFRLDAYHFDPHLEGTQKDIRSAALPWTPLGEVAEIALPGRFERVWAEDDQHGVPYLDATDLLSLFSVGLPARCRYLSHKTDVDMAQLIVREDWLLLTCSGTIGRVFHVPKRLDGWAATHDLIRIIPNEGMAGYLFAWCMTEAAQRQILAHTHGGQIDHVTDDQVRQMMVPVLPGAEAKKLNRAVLKALKAREKGLAQLEGVWPRP